MRPRLLFLALVIGLTAPWLGGCAKLNQWLEGTAGEEEKKDAEDPQKTYDDQTKALAGTDQAKRKDAVGKLLGLATAKPPTNAEQAKTLEIVRPKARADVIKLLADSDPGVSQAALAGVGGAIGFPEKTEDERQLDPDAYNRQLTLKRAVFNDGLKSILGVVQDGDGDRRYSALVALYNLAKAPICCGDEKLSEEKQAEQGRQQLNSQLPAPVCAVAADLSMPTDVRLMAIEAAVAVQGWQPLGGILPALLSDSEPRIIARACLAAAQAAPGLGAARQSIEGTLRTLAAGKDLPDVSWRATLALGALKSAEGAKLTQAVLPPPLPTNSKKEPDKSDAPGMAPLEAYRTYALSNGGAASEVGQLNRGVDKVATAAEEQLAAERKKGYK